VIVFVRVDVKDGEDVGVAEGVMGEGVADMVVVAEAGRVLEAIRVGSDGILEAKNMVEISRSGVMDGTGESNTFSSVATLFKDVSVAGKSVISWMRIFSLTAGTSIT
jgi:hypothetical protein